MKHWNKNPKLRKTWHSVTVTANGYKNYLIFDRSMHSSKQWCWKHESSGRFYVDISHAFNSYDILFEREEDAVWFKLSWMK